MQREKPARPRTKRTPAKPSPRPSGKSTARPAGKSSAKPGIAPPGKSSGKPDKPSGKPSGRPGKPGKPSGKLSGKPSAKGANLFHHQPVPVKVQWAGLRPMFDFWGLEMKRFYQMDTLCHAVEWMLHTKRDRFLMRSVRDALGPAPVNSLVFELFQEGKFQLIFRLRAGNVKRRHHQFAFVVAKRGGDFSTVAQGEHAILTQLHARAPEYVVQPFGGGNIFLPDRHNRPEHGRDIYAYLTQWLSEYHELGVDKDLQLIVNIVPRHKCTVDQTERIKGQIVEVVLRTYDAKKGECMEMPQVASGDFVVTHPTRGEPRVKLIACRRMLRHVTPVKLVDKILGASWDWGGREFHLPPADPGVLFSAFERALGAETARDWFRQYVVAVKARRVPAQAAYPVELLEPFAQ